MVLFQVFGVDIGSKARRGELWLSPQARSQAEDISRMKVAEAFPQKAFAYRGIRPSPWPTKSIVVRVHVAASERICS